MRRVRERTTLGISLAQIGRELGVRADLLHRWDRGCAAEAAAASGASPAELEREVRRLRRDNETLRQERDFAKKSGGVFREGVPVSAKYAVITAHRTLHNLYVYDCGTHY